MTADELISILLKNRGLDSPGLVEAFFHPPNPLDIPLSVVGLSESAVSSAISVINQQLTTNNSIAIYGDYDVDGICSTAIIWETLYGFTKSVFPYIPHRREEGYGLTKTGIDRCLEKGARLIIVVDSGIVAGKAVDYCHSRGCQIIIIDHHEAGSEIPRADAILHTTQTSAAGISWFFIREFLKNRESSFLNHESELLTFAAISVICDLVPLLGINRSLAKWGLSQLNATARPGLLALFSEAGLSPGGIGAYEVGFVIGPRLNAMGRLGHALDSLRLLCTTDSQKAADLAKLLADTNRHRQELTQKSADHALAQFDPLNLPGILMVADSQYDEGIVGLIASKLVEKYYRPAIAVSVGAEVSKASARSVTGFHITEFLRQFPDILTSVGGHSMAAGFSVPTAKLNELKSRIIEISRTAVPDRVLVRNQRIDAQIPAELLGLDLYLRLSDFAPFGLGNPRPVLMSFGMPVNFARRIGTGARHLRFNASGLEAIYFNAPAGLENDLTAADLTYQLDSHTWNGRTNLQLIIRELKSAV